jgi:hypothetical protein
MQGCDRFGFQWSLLPSVTATEMKFDVYVGFLQQDGTHWLAARCMHVAAGGKALHLGLPP